MNHDERKRIEVCFTPRSYGLYKSDATIAVVIDVLRATSAICTAIDYGVKSIIPVSSIAEAMEYKKLGYIVGAEREGKKVEGFDLGNSPYSYMDPSLKGKSIVLTTTNGTKTINIARQMKTVAIGSLNNLNAICQWLVDRHENVLIIGSGWKDKFNLEDTICAGAIADHLLSSGNFYANEDSSIASVFIYRSARENIFSFLKASSHRRRLRKLNLNEDIKYCLTPNNLSSIPVIKGNEIVKLAYSYAKTD
jgi:2-phosphosulfolactate phosphatase